MPHRSALASRCHSTYQIAQRQIEVTIGMENLEWVNTPAMQIIDVIPKYFLSEWIDWHGCPMICLYGAAWQRCNHSHGQRRVHRPYTKRLSASIASGRDLTLTCSARGRPRTAPEKLRSSYPSDNRTGIRFIRKFAPQSALSETCQQDFDSTLRVKVRLWKTP